MDGIGGCSVVLPLDYPCVTVVLPLFYWCSTLSVPRTLRQPHSAFIESLPEFDSVGLQAIQTELHFPANPSAAAVPRSRQKITTFQACLDTAANPGARTFLSAAALEANMRADGADRRPGVAADRNVRAPAVVSGCAPYQSSSQMEAWLGPSYPQSLNARL